MSKKNKYDKMVKCRVEALAVRRAVQKGEALGPGRHASKIGGSNKKKTIHDHARDWQYLQKTVSEKGIELYQEDQFLDAMEELVRLEAYHVSRYDKYRATVAEQHLMAVDAKTMTMEQCWTRSKSFSLKFKCLRAKAKTAYLKKKSSAARSTGKKRLEEDNDPDDGLRGAIVQQKGEQLVKHFLNKGQRMYAQGVSIAHGGLLRHGELMEAKHEHFYKEAGNWHVKVIGGKFRQEDHIDYVFLDKCENALRQVLRSGTCGKVFPDWNPEVVREGIRECARQNGWDQNRKWDFHCLRHGKAVDNRLAGMPKELRMERGRWQDEKVEKHYSRFR